jgi:hypothetical protein
MVLVFCVSNVLGLVAALMVTTTLCGLGDNLDGNG